MWCISSSEIEAFLGGIDTYWAEEIRTGAAHRSIRTLDFSKKLYFLFNWMSLKAARARYPFSFANLYHLSRRPLPCFFWIAILSWYEDGRSGASM